MSPINTLTPPVNRLQSPDVSPRGHQNQTDNLFLTMYDEPLMYHMYCKGCRTVAQSRDRGVTNENNHHHHHQGSAYMKETRRAPEWLNSGGRYKQEFLGILKVGSFV